MDETGAVLPCGRFVNALQLGSMQLSSVSMKAMYATYELKAITFMWYCLFRFIT